MYVCICRSVTDSQIRQAIAEGANNIRQLRNCLGVASQCGKCGKQVCELLQQKPFPTLIPTVESYAT